MIYFTRWYTTEFCQVQLLVVLHLAFASCLSWSLSPLVNKSSYGKNKIKIYDADPTLPVLVSFVLMHFLIVIYWDFLIDETRAYKVSLVPLVPVQWNKLLVTSFSHSDSSVNKNANGTSSKHTTLLVSISCHCCMLPIWYWHMQRLCFGRKMRVDASRECFLKAQVEVHWCCVFLTTLDKM